MKCPDCGEELIVVAEWPDKDGIEYIGDCENCHSYWRWHNKNDIERFFCG